MNEILEKLMAALPKVEAGATEVIELATTIKTAAQEAGVWTETHENVLQAAVAASAPAVPVGTPPKASALLILIAAFGLAVTAHAQISPTNIVAKITTNAVQQTAVDNAINALEIGITNYSVDLYATYAPSVPDGNAKFGGGIMALYNFNQNAGAGIGLDWLGQFSLVSGNLQLQAPFHLSTILPVLKNVPIIGTAVIDPFAIGGVGTPYSGNGHFNGSPMVITDLGAGIQFGHLWGGQFNAGIAWGKWIGNGPYGNVVRYHAFAGYGHGLGAVETIAPDIGP
jgi:hypothetical protein